jgi:transcriptional regulator with XRE-family HTH domain
MRLKKVIGQNVRRLRKAKGLTQEQLAQEVGVDMRYLGSIERGEANPSISVIVCLGKALNVHPSTLLLD